MRLGKATPRLLRHPARHVEIHSQRQVRPVYFQCADRQKTKCLALVEFADAAVRDVFGSEHVHRRSLQPAPQAVQPRWQTATMAMAWFPADGAAPVQLTATVSG